MRCRLFLLEKNSFPIEPGGARTICNVRNVKGNLKSPGHAGKCGCAAKNVGMNTISTKLLVNLTQKQKNY
jgi:hypothetical protein